MGNKSAESSKTETPLLARILLLLLGGIICIFGLFFLIISAGGFGESPTTNYMTGRVVVVGLIGIVVGAGIFYTGLSISS